MLKQQIVSVNGFVVSAESRAQAVLQQAEQELDSIQALKKDIKAKGKTIIRRKSA